MLTALAVGPAVAGLAGPPHPGGVRWQVWQRRRTRRGAPLVRKGQHQEKEEGQVVVGTAALRDC